MKTKTHVDKSKRNLKMHKKGMYPIKRAHVRMTRRKKRDWERRLLSNRDVKTLKDQDDDLEKANGRSGRGRDLIGKKVPTNLVLGKTTTHTLQKAAKSGVSLTRSTALIREDTRRKNMKGKQIGKQKSKIRIPRKLLLVPSYVGQGYDMETICRMNQKQAIHVAREIVTQQSKRLFSKLTNYLFKGKMLVNLTKLKINKALKSKIREMLKPQHMGFTEKDIDNLDIDPMSPIREDLDEAEDFITDQTYNEFQDGSKLPDVSEADQNAWNLN